jgi:energy-coupling factor transporter ATP-binding protein EcfA2
MAESNIHHIPEYADALYVLERGEIIYRGKPGDTYPPEVMKVITARLKGKPECPGSSPSSRSTPTGSDGCVFPSA